MWDKPSFACLGSRFPVGTRVTLDRVERVGMVESRLRALGFRQFRARWHELAGAPIVRIELDPEELALATKSGVREAIVGVCKEQGFRHVTLDSRRLPEARRVSLDGHALPVAPIERGDRASDTSPEARRRVLTELTLLWLACLLAMRAVVALQPSIHAAGVLDAARRRLRTERPRARGGAAPLHLRTRGALSLARASTRGPTVWRFRRSAIGRRGARRSCSPRRSRRCCSCRGSSGTTCTRRWFSDGTPGHHWPPDYPTLVLYQVFFVAIPEEFFYRGYFQTRLDEVFDRRFLVLGTPIGWGAVIATLYFAFGHSLVQFQWWHFATFFPGMVFAWMRERTGGVAAGALFHATCNVLVVSMDTFYGVIPPR